jgi:hypothetical protein
VVLWCGHVVVLEMSCLKPNVIVSGFGVVFASEG